ncbi:unnamed protein product [Tuber melanosporum]|uniref:(Perigord truffle) hypothetical protein n=1 Tax=Tuber melanosporum (strain Mel28) TaxID=656061 RepID=D5G5X1_TUBMM|nr:uncharacterized protein GSTUM_00001608001 [Tuber melanosporum]CAZ79914.1 unnamed protein product [Tuber melanosporum]
MASPPKRPKLSDSPSLPFHRSASPSKLPVRNDSSALYRSPTRPSLTKRNLQHARRSPYAEPVKKRFVSASQDETNRAGRLNFGSGSGGAGGMFTGRARSESVGTGIRRAGGSRLSSSPARRRGGFSNALAPSVPPSEDSPEKSELGILQEEGGVEDVKSPEPASVMKKSGAREGPPQPRQQQQGGKRKWPETEMEAKQRVEKERLERIMAARVQVLQAEIMELQEEVKIEKARVGRETQAAKDLDQDTDALVKRLLAVNDASQVVSIPKPRQKEPVPSARPVEPDDPLSQLKAFTSITFTTHNSKIIPSTPVNQIITASGYTSNRLLYFTVSLSIQSATVQEITHRISPWSVRELTPVLTTAVTEGDIPTVFHAISTYTLIAKTRASVFAKLSATFPHLLPILAKGKKEKGKVSRREIIPYLGESLLCFHPRAKTDKASRCGGSGVGGSGVELVLEWRIEFDVTGEPESVISADVRLPSYLKEADELNSFSRLGGVFDLLVKEKGVYDAATCVVGLLFQ